MWISLSSAAVESLATRRDLLELLYGIYLQENEDDEEDEEETEGY